MHASGRCARRVTLLIRKKRLIALAACAPSEAGDPMGWTMLERSGSWRQTIGGTRSVSTLQESIDASSRYFVHRPMG